MSHKDYYIPSDYIGYKELKDQRPVVELYEIFIYPEKVTDLSKTQPDRANDLYNEIMNKYRQLIIFMQVIFKTQTQNYSTINKIS